MATCTPLVLLVASVVGDKSDLMFAKPIEIFVWDPAKNTAQVVWGMRRKNDAEGKESCATAGSGFGGVGLR